MAQDTSKYIYSDVAQKGYGYNGVTGDRFTSVAGWEHGTAGFAGNIYSRLASENGIQPVDPTITASREPFKIGRFIIKLMKPAPFWDPVVTRAWRYILEDTALEFSGINDYSFDVFTRTHGVTRQTSAYGGTYKENNGEFTIKVPETVGQLVRKSIDYWLQGCSDQKTGVAHFYGKNIRDLQPNKSISILYILLGPECRAETIEYACMYHDAIITAPKHAHNNSGALGETGQGVDHDLSFNGLFDRSAEIDRLAAIIVDREGLYEERADNAVLPSYIYTNYIGNSDKEFSDELVGMTLADRLKHDANIGAGTGHEDTTGYKNNGDMTTFRSKIVHPKTGSSVTRPAVSATMSKKFEGGASVTVSEPVVSESAADSGNEPSVGGPIA